MIRWLFAAKLLTDLTGIMFVGRGWSVVFLGMAVADFGTWLLLSRG